MQIRDNAPCVMVYGRDAGLLDIRAKIIYSAGYRTCLAESETKVAEQLNRAHCEVVVLCYSLADAEAKRASVLAKSNKPPAKVLALESFWSNATLDSADGVVGQFGGPVELLAELKRLTTARL